jgi:hypothetical protein
MARKSFRFSGYSHYVIGHDCLMQRPTLAAIVAGCNDLWSNIELQLSLTLGAILDSTSPAAVGVYLSLRNSRAQRDALTAAAQVALRNDDLVVFNCVLRLHERFGAQRNDLVHGFLALRMTTRTFYCGIRPLGMLPGSLIHIIGSGKWKTSCRTNV